MSVLWTLDTLLQSLLEADSIPVLGAELADFAKRLGFEHYWLARYGSGSPRAAPLHSFDSGVAGLIDNLESESPNPLLRAARATCLGFDWRDIVRLIEMTPADADFFSVLADHGLAQGFSVPTHIGATAYLCSFCGTERPTLDPGQRLVAQLVGLFACERFARDRPACLARRSRVPLTKRQRECLLWAARAKTNWEIAQILGIGEKTVETHLSHARARYGQDRRIALIVHALSDGTLSFEDVLHW